MRECSAPARTAGRTIEVVVSDDLLVDEGDGTLREPYWRLGRLTVGAAKPRRRRRAAIKWRRPSFLTRRKVGRPASQLAVYRGEHEIIARN